MRDSDFIKFKLKIAIALTLILFLIFAKSLIDKRNVEELEESFISVYEDRLVVQDYLFSILEQLFRMKTLVVETESLAEYDSVQDQVLAYHDSILVIIAEFEKTKLTTLEAEYLEEFKGLVQNQLDIEVYFAHQNDKDITYQESLIKFNNDFERVLLDLKELSKIQLAEGEKLVKRSYRIKARSDIWLQFEFAVLFILLLMIVLLVYTSKTLKKI